MIPSPDIFEKLATFYLGRQYDLDAGKLRDELLMYDAKDLCTHAMCVGMTGSGKTGLCLSLLEEAAIDGIPSICVDPKGDLANLLLTFPDLQPADFKPWLEPGEATRKGMTLDEFASDRAESWKKGLADWGQTPARIRKFRESVEIDVFTPGSNIGLPMTVLKSFDSPPPEVINDFSAMRDRVTGSTSGLLTLMGIDADPLLSTEHILIASILDHCWRAGRNVSIGDLIGLISTPPITRVGVLDLESFMPTAERSKLAMRLNNLLASPAFATWLQGRPLSIKQLLHNDAGKPRISILSIAHLSDRERMFFVTILLNEMVAWMRTQSGTSSLRAMFYMDEVAGYFPPVANPPSKPPMLTLLKQARAFGLGITLATQNPVDLDYKGLSNIGTWFLGRLQTERDKARVLEGLEGAATHSGQPFNRGEMERLLASLGNRIFLMNNVHDAAPTVFQTRWAMSFLAGPLAQNQISRLMDPKRAAIEAAAEDRRQPTDHSAPVVSRPVVPAGTTEQFLRADPFVKIPPQSHCVYRPAVQCSGTLHFIRASADVDFWRDENRLVPCDRGVPDPFWQSSVQLHRELKLDDEPEDGFGFAELPDELRSRSHFRSLQKEFKDYLYRHHALTLYKSPLLGSYAPGGSDAAAARLHFEQIGREQRDLETEKLRAKYAKKRESLEKKIRDAELKVGREQDQYEEAKMSSYISIGTGILGAFLGRKWASRTNVSKVGTAARSGSRAIAQRNDIAHAREELRELADEQRDLDTELRGEIAELAEKFAVDNLELETFNLPPRKSDLKVVDPVLVWTPWAVDASGLARPLHSPHEK